MIPHKTVTLALVVLVVGAGAAIPAAAHSADGPYEDNQGNDNRVHSLTGPTFAHWADGPNDDNKANDNNRGNDNRAHGHLGPALA